MGAWLLHLVQRVGVWAGCGPAQSPRRCTKAHLSTASVPLPYDGPLLCGFNVAIKALIVNPAIGCDYFLPSPHAVTFPAA